MNVPFFDSNPEIVSELSAMDHRSKAYKKHLRKVLLEIGGPVSMLNILKEDSQGAVLRKQYFRNLLYSGLFLILMFVWILAGVALIGDKEIYQFNSPEMVIFIAFVVIELITVFLALFFAFRGQNLLMQGTSYLIDHYQQVRSGEAGQKLGEYAFPKAKSNTVAIIAGVVVMLVVFGLTSLSNGTFAKLFPAGGQTFTKAGLTITLTKDFQEKEIVSQTVTYMSAKHFVMGLKEEFALLEQNGLSRDLSAWDYAEIVIDNNAINTTLAGEENQPLFIYSKAANGKDFTYLVKVYKGSDAFGLVTFGCETDDFAKSLEQLNLWASSVRVD